MPYIARDHAFRILRPYFDDFVSIVDAAWDDWKNSEIAASMQHKRVRASYVWNQLITHAKRRFDSHDRIQVVSLKHWDGLLVDDSIFIRMKKGTPSLLSRNYPTQAALAFNDPIQDLFGGVARLELLYVLGKAEAEVERVVLAQRNGSQLAWSIDVVGDMEGFDNIEPFAHGAAEESNWTAADRVIRRKTPDYQRKDGTQDGSK